MRLSRSNRSRKEGPRLKLRTLIIGLVTISVLGSSCASRGSRSETVDRPTVASDTTNIKRPSKHDAMDTIRSEVPAEVKSAFPEAATVIVQHKEFTVDQVKFIEQESGATIVDPDFHSFIAHESHRRIGAATISEVKQPEMRLLIVFTPSMKIRKVTAIAGDINSVGKPFLDQFVGKDGRTLFRLGDDLQYDGANKRDAMAIARAIKRDVMAMGILYGRI